MSGIIIQIVLSGILVAGSVVTYKYWLRPILSRTYTIELYALYKIIGQLKDRGLEIKDLKEVEKEVLAKLDDRPRDFSGDQEESLISQMDDFYDKDKKNNNKKGK